ncbi:MAG: ribbon-helix-helix domain-containing protein, partial [Acidobacteriota bacterium]|nr:ribbon-helix-helix domain-containing protein [Acidobacteriota bacterium]
MQTTVDIPEEQVGQLDTLSRSRHISRDELVRTAISTYLQAQASALDESFGAWAGSQGDGLD